MDRKNKPLVSEARRNDRYLVTLMCCLHTDTLQISGTTVDISTGGLAVRLHDGMIKALEHQVTRVTIEQIGTIPASVRWQSNDKVGLIFNIPSRGEHPVEKFLIANGIEKPN